LRNTPLRTIAQRVGTSPWALHRHKKHLPAQLVQAQQAEIVTEATSLLDRVESLMQESEKIAAAAKQEKNWPAATSALREARGCLELLAKLRGELQQAGSLHLHKHLHATAPPQTEAEVERAIALEVATATDGFSSVKIAELKALAEAAGIESTA